MKSMKCLMAILAGAVTTTAFGAASVRAPKVGIATSAPAAATNTARAGTLRAQTLKNTSVAAAPTTVTPIATSAARETTDARMSFLAKVKNKPNIGSIKDKAAAQQELDTISDQIEELQAKLDTAKTEQTTVLTQSNIDDKITENI